MAYNSLILEMNADESDGVVARFWLLFRHSSFHWIKYFVESRNSGTIEWLVA